MKEDLENKTVRDIQQLVDENYLKPVRNPYGKGTCEGHFKPIMVDTTYDVVVALDCSGHFLGYDLTKPNIAVTAPDSNWVLQKNILITATDEENVKELKYKLVREGEDPDTIEWIDVKETAKKVEATVDLTTYGKYYLYVNAIDTSNNRAEYKSDCYKILEYDHYEIWLELAEVEAIPESLEAAFADTAILDQAFAVDAANDYLLKSQQVLFPKAATTAYSLQKMESLEAMRLEVVKNKSYLEQNVKQQDTFEAIGSTNWQATIKAASNYRSELVPVFLAGIGISNLRKYQLGFPCYLYHNGALASDITTLTYRAHSKYGSNTGGSYSLTNVISLSYSDQPKNCGAAALGTVKALNLAPYSRSVVIVTNSSISANGNVYLGVFGNPITGFNGDWNQGGRFQKGTQYKDISSTNSAYLAFAAHTGCVSNSSWVSDSITVSTWWLE